MASFDLSCQEQIKQRDALKQQFTVLGGWRSHSDLLRLLPGLIKKGLIGGRIELMTRGTCAYVFSHRPLSGDLLTTTSASTAGTLRVALPRLAPSWWCICARSNPTDTQINGVSYAKLLVPSVGGANDPDFLDDQPLGQGKNHTVLPLESYQISIIPFVRACRIKDELNDQIRQHHPQIHHPYESSEQS
eukprot:TRINITY_DN28538_c0_g1_i1.p1 TRINITY_DN28538_c0_g1~~TRINITY_DN28538_c0_g1_i1.p1  ORF type:complete len:200 (-),score=18.40 TRINITY_DN28538_c0_g1_i1:66-632(-)